MKQSVSIFLLYMASQVVAGALSVLWVLLPNLFRGGKPDMGSPSPLVLSISSALLSALLVAGLLAYYRREERRTPHRRAVKALDAAGVGGAVVSLLLLNFAIDFLLRPLHLSDGSMLDTLQAMLHCVPGWLLICLIGPITEEMVFRRGILHYLERSGVQVPVSIGASALVFAIVHGNLAQGIPALLLGIALGILYHRSRSVWLCVAAHVANNTVAALLMFLPDLPDSWWLSLLSVPLLALAWWIGRRTLQHVQV